mmetsp:Transcript_23709/g.56417  ORF Transcript_23709/g.56417 Transcript_23709/m.56417 type:complete len:227 (+) Transcript_23709:42-722(+)
MKIDSGDGASVSGNDPMLISPAPNLMTAAPPSAPRTSGGRQPLNETEEAELRRYYEERTVSFCKKLSIPLKVRITALTFFKRFYLKMSVMDHPPKLTMLACVWLATKAEEGQHHKLSGGDYADKGGYEIDDLVAMEQELLTVLEFSVWVFSPFRCLSGYVEDWQKEAVASQDVPEDTQKKIVDRAEQFLNIAMLTDAPLTATPSMLALAAFRAACIKEGVRTFDQK